MRSRNGSRLIRVDRRARCRPTRGVDRISVGGARRAPPRRPRPRTSNAARAIRSCARGQGRDRPGDDDQHRRGESCSTSVGVPPSAARTSSAASMQQQRARSRRGGRRGRSPRAQTASAATANPAALARAGPAAGAPRPWAAKPTTNAAAAIRTSAGQPIREPSVGLGGPSHRPRSRAAIQSRYAARIAPTSRAARPRGAASGSARTGERDERRRPAPGARSGRPGRRRRRRPRRRPPARPPRGSGSRPRPGRLMGRRWRGPGRSASARMPNVSSGQ